MPDLSTVALILLPLFFFGVKYAIFIMPFYGHGGAEINDPPVVQLYHNLITEDLQIQLFVHHLLLLCLQNQLIGEMEQQCCLLDPAWQAVQDHPIVDLRHHHQSIYIVSITIFHYLHNSPREPSLCPEFLLEHIPDFTNHLCALPAPVVITCLNRGKGF